MAGVAAGELDQSALRRGTVFGGGAPTLARGRRDEPERYNEAMSVASTKTALGPNTHLAESLREAGDLLEQQGANPFRIAAYRRAAGTVAELDRDVAAVLEHDGMEGLTALPHIGRGIAAALREMVETGRWGQLERLRGATDPVALFQTVPGLGPGLARKIHDALDIDSLEALEVAAHDGRLEVVPGIGGRRAAMVRAGLATLLRRPRPWKTPTHPSVDELLVVDREYRELAAAGRLRKIAPRRFNPDLEAWLPVFHLQREPWHFTAMFSNTARAHELGRTGDWVVIYFDNDHDGERQATVVTETHGPLAGRRVVRGREAECRELYEQNPSPASPAPGH